MKSAISLKIDEWIQNRPDIDKQFIHCLRTYMANWQKEEAEDYISLMGEYDFSQTCKGFDSLRYSIHEDCSNDDGSLLESITLFKKVDSLLEETVEYYLVYDVNGDIIDDGISINRI